MADQDIKATGELLRSLRKRRRRVITVREAATRAGLSPGRWSQIEKGAMTVGGQEITVRAPADTLARMVLALGGTPDELTKAGREDAAEVLAELWTHNARGNDAFLDAFFDDPEAARRGFDSHTIEVVPDPPPVREPAARDQDTELDSWIEQIQATSLPEHVKAALVAQLNFLRGQRNAL